MNLGLEDETLAPISNQKLVRKFGQSPIFIASTQLVDCDDGTLKHGSLASQLTEAIHVISYGYEAKTEWGKEVTKSFTSLSSSKTLLNYCFVKQFLVRKEETLI